MQGNRLSLRFQCFLFVFFSILVLQSKVYLTSRERKKIRRQNRKEAQKEQTEKIRYVVFFLIKFKHLLINDEHKF